MRDAPRPTTKKEIRSYFGLVGYYQDFTPTFSTIAAPLSDLTRKGQPNKVVWGEPQERSYHTLKHAIVSKPVFMLPNVDEEFILRTDTSDVGLGATLLQWRDGQIFPVAYNWIVTLPLTRFPSLGVQSDVILAHLVLLILATWHAHCPLLHHSLPLYLSPQFYILLLRSESCLSLWCLTMISPCFVASL